MRIDDLINKLGARKKNIEDFTFRGRLIPPSAQITLDVKGVGKALDAFKDAFKDPKLVRAIAVKLEQALTKAIQENRWPSASGGNVDIVDTGALLASQQVQIEGSNIKISYGVDYAGIVFYGGYIQPYGNPNARPVYLPPRPWTDVLQTEFDYESEILPILISFLK